MPTDDIDGDDDRSTVAASKLIGDGAMGLVMVMADAGRAFWLLGITNN